MDITKPSKPNPIDKVKIGLPVNTHLLRDLKIDIVDKHSVNRLDPNSLMISPENKKNFL